MSENNPNADDRFERMEEIFCEAMSISSIEERSAYLKKVCKEDGALLEELERIVFRNQESEDFFEQSRPATTMSAVEITNTLSEIPEFFDDMDHALADDDEVGKQIGNFKLLQKIGEGGVGNVYLAEQLKPVRRQVALKIIKLGMDTKSVIARFEAERQALAMMEHPNIAHVLGAGETEKGRPFFVMELVHGVRITSYCDQAGLSVRQRLQLFVQVCHAIQHAHQKGIIHRDIKPSNVLITKQSGELMPMVIDFGIAKATGENLLSDQTMLTAQEPIIGTPAYMSPEQSKMGVLDVDTRSDIYSLGVLLYELLTGKTPFNQKELLADGLEEMRHILCEREPAKPSSCIQKLGEDEQEKTARARSLEVRRLGPMLEGDLDCIVLRALEKDRSRRYETVEALANDVGRYLNDEPVEARPPSRLYRFGKLVSRNKIVFAAGLAVLFALVGGFSVSTWMFIKAEEARENEAMLRHRAEDRERIAQAAFAISRGLPDEADRLIEGIQIEGPSIEGAAVMRALAKWNALQGNLSRAAEQYRQLLEVNPLDDREVQSLDFLAAGVVFSELGASEDYAWLRMEMIGRMGSDIPSMAVARMLMAALLKPVGASVLNELSGYAAPRLPAEAALPDEEMSPVAWWDRLELGFIETSTPSELIKNENGIRTFLAGGANIWDIRDSFVFANMAVSGDFDFCLRVQQIEALDTYTRAGLMARSSLREAGSRHIMVAVNAGNSYQVLVRSTDNATTASLPPNPLPAAWGTNSWVRLQRVGSAFRGYSSDNGRDWVLLDSYDSAIGAEGPMSEIVYFGIAACAHSVDGQSKVVLSDFGVPSIRSVDALLAMALLQYRSGDFSACIDTCRQCLSHPDLNVARAPVLRILFALSYQKTGELDAAREQLDLAREVISRKFDRGLVEGGGSQGYWFEWMYARLLLRQAESALSE